MIHLLQRPLRDELLTSALIRTSRHAHLPIPVVVRVLTGRPKLAPSFFQATHIVALAGAFEVDPKTLLSKHTVFPYATAFLESDVFEARMVSALATGKAATGIGATIQSVSDFVRWRQYCIDCVREDTLRWGESYWHRAHNLPGVLVCTIHGRVLRRTALLTSSGGGSWSYLLPQEAPGTRVLSKRASRFDIALARHSVSLLDRPLDLQPKNLPVQYRQALVEKGLLSADRDIDVMEMVRWARRIVGANPARYGLSPSESKLQWLGLMARPATTIPFVPLKHVILQSVFELQPSVDTPMFDFSPTGFLGHVSGLVDLRYAQAVRRVTAMHLKAGLTVRVPDALTMAKCWEPYRHNRAAFPRTQAAVMELRQSMASARRIGKT